MRISAVVGEFAHQWIANWDFAVRFDEDVGETV
jgi:hypothetical protein